MWIFWLSLIIVLTIVELSTISLVSIWFIASALVSLIVSFFTDSVIIQFSIFVILGVILLITTKPILDKYIKPKSVKTNLDKVVGMHGIVTEKITKNKIGEVKVDGKRWSAKADKTINVDEEVVIEKIEGVKLIVRKESDN